MTERKPLPPTGKDNRRVYPVDALKAKFWYSVVKQRGDFKSNYALAKAFGGEHKQWAAYSRGAQPNELILDTVEANLYGSKEIFTAGPDQLKLWPAMHFDDVDTLRLISDRSIRADGLIARFRLDAMKGDIRLTRGCDPADETFEDMIREILMSLHGIMEWDFVLEIGSILRNWSEPYELQARQRENEIFMDLIIDSRFGLSYLQEWREKEAFENIQAPTVKNKGRRKIDED